MHAQKLTKYRILFFEERVEQQCYEPTLNWLSAPTGNVTEGRKKKNLCILVIHVTTTTSGSPSASSADTSDQVFGPSDNVNIATQYAACSNNQLDFYAAVPTGISLLVAGGVYDITVSTASTRHLEEIMIKLGMLCFFIKLIIISSRW